MSSEPPSPGHWAFGKSARIPARRSDLREHAGETGCLLYDTTRGTTLMLTDTAYNVWRNCDGVRTPEELALIQTAAFEVEYAAALDHVEQLVVKFGDSGLLEV